MKPKNVESIPCQSEILKAELDLVGSIANEIVTSSGIELSDVPSSEGTNAEVHISDEQTVVPKGDDA